MIPFELATVFGSTIEITRIRDPGASTPWTAVGFGVMILRVVNSPFPLSTY